SYVYYARYNLDRGRLEEAKSLAEKAIALNSSSYLARDIAMSAYQALKMWPELGSVAESTLELLPGDVKASQYLQASKEKKPLVVSMQNVENAPPTEALINLSLQQYKEGKYADCIATCNLVLQQDPRNANAYNNICAA